MKLSANVLAVLAVVCIGVISVSGVRERSSKTAPNTPANQDGNATQVVEEGNETAGEAKEIPPEDVFMPACEKHLTTLVDGLRASYTHMQISTVLAHWCMEQNYTHRFSNETVCNEFSKLLEEAHVERLENASQTGGITDICKKYYDEEMVAKADNGAWLWAKGDEDLPKFEEGGKDVNGTQEPPLKACGGKIKTIMTRLQNAYTYNQLPGTLMNACQGHHKYESSEHKKSCIKLVKHLMKAHDAEIEGKVEKEEEKKKEDEDKKKDDAGEDGETEEEDPPEDSYAGFCKAYNGTERVRFLTFKETPLVELIALTDVVEPTVSSMRAEAHKRRLRAEGKAAPGAIAVSAAMEANNLINADAKELLSLLLNKHDKDDHGGKAAKSSEDGKHGKAEEEAVEEAVLENSTGLNGTDGPNNDLPPLDVYLPACLDHTKKLIKDLSAAYTEVQLPTALEHACELDEDVHKFNDEISCKEFADRLVKAHESDDQEAGYTQFCKDFYVHKGGVIGEPEKEEIKEEVEEKVSGPRNNSLYGIIAILSIIVVIVVVGTITNLKNHA